MFLFAEFGFCSAGGTDGVEDFSGFQVSAAALIAFITACVFAAVGAGSFDVPVGEEAFAVRAVALLDGFFVDVAFFDQGLDDGGGPAVVRRVVGHAEPVEPDSHCLKDFVEVCVIVFGDGTRGGVLGFGGDDDGGSVVVGAADEDDVVAKPPQVADIEVAGDVGPQVAKVAQTVGIGKTTGDDCRLIGHSG